MLGFRLLVAVALSLVSCLAMNQQLEVVGRFHHYTMQYNKPYNNPNHPEYQYRLGVFRANLERIDELNNQPGQTAVFEVNEFADLTEEEFSARLMPPRQAPIMNPNNKLSLPPLRANSAPQEFDWREKGAVGEVRNQGSAGSCFSFSAIQNVEALNFLAGRPYTEFSTEQIVDCTSNQDENGDSCCGVNGGWPFIVLDYVMKKGVATEQNYPYCVGSGSCRPCAPPGYNQTYCGPYTTKCDPQQARCESLPGPLTTISSWHHIDKNETEVLNALLHVGPLSVCLDAGPLQFYKSGVLAPRNCTKTLTHAVLITGYGTLNGQDYWIVKNSWGARWGMEGYFLIARGVGMCGINEAVVTGII